MSIVSSYSNRTSHVSNGAENVHNFTKITGRIGKFTLALIALSDVTKFAHATSSNPGFADVVMQAMEASKEGTFLEHLEKSNQDLDPFIDQEDGDVCSSSCVDGKGAFSSCWTSCKAVAQFSIETIEKCNKRCGWVKNLDGYAHNICHSICFSYEGFVGVSKVFANKKEEL